MMTIGSLNNRQLTVEMHAPAVFQRWDYDNGFRLDWPKLFSLRRWWRAVFSRWSWRVSWRFHYEGSHRCYCPDGTMFDGNITLAGFVLLWWYSHFWGEIPCWCDKAVEAMERDE